MIVDSSAILAIIRHEPLAATCFQALLPSSRNRLPAANFLEACLVIDGSRNPTASREFDGWIDEFSIVIEPVTVRQIHVARRAHQRYGRGSGHPARLNFGDCFAYALAKDLDEPLLFVGQDCVHTDVR